MNSKDLKGFTKRLTGLCEIWDKEVTEALTDIYWESLKGFDFDTVCAAISKCAVACKFFPKPADIVEAIGGSPADRATEAFHLLLEAVKRIGPYESVVFEDPGMQAVVEAWGGWVEVCGKTEEEWRYLGKDFAALYARGAEGMQDRRHFAGLHEGHNRVEGHTAWIKGPVQVGAEKGRLRLSPPRDSKALCGTAAASMDDEYAIQQGRRLA